MEPRASGLAEREASAGGELAAFLAGCSFETTARDRASLDEAADLLDRGTEVFVANLPGDGPDTLVAAAARVRRAGLVPVPHLVARNLADRKALDAMLAGLSAEAGVDRALILGGDRDRPAGPFGSALDLVETDALQASGIGLVALACYPERHPRIAEDVLHASLLNKLEAVRRRGLESMLVSQFAFEAQPIVAMARRLRAAGVTAPLRIGLAGPVNRTRLIKYALRCGVGPSLRALRERPDFARNALAGETPEALATEIAVARAREPQLGISGLHLFTFGALASSAEWVRAERDARRLRFGV